MSREFEVYKRQTSAFRRKFGREMGPNDPFFFDPDADTPRFRRPAEAGYAMAKLAELLLEVGADAAHIYAFHKTRGLLPPGAADLTPRERAEWQAAVNEYYRIVS